MGKRISVLLARLSTWSNAVLTRDTSTTLTASTRRWGVPACGLQVSWRKLRVRFQKVPLVTFFGRNRRTLFCGCYSVRFCCVLQLLIKIWLTQQNLCCIISNSTTKYQQNSYWKSNFRLISCGCRKCMFRDFFLEHIDSPNCVCYWMWSR